MKTLIITILLGLSLITYGQDSLINCRLVPVFFRGQPWFYEGQRVVYTVCDTVKPSNEIDEIIESLSDEVMVSRSDTVAMFTYYETPPDTTEVILLYTYTDTIPFNTYNTTFMPARFALWAYGYKVETCWGEISFLNNDKTALPPEIIIWDYKLLNK